MTNEECKIGVRVESNSVPAFRGTIASEPFYAISQRESRMLVLVELDGNWAIPIVGGGHMTNLAVLPQRLTRIPDVGH